MSAASDIFRFIYVRVPRTGSSTFMHYLETAFKPYLVDVGHQHASAVELRDLWKDKWHTYHTFGFIRNPWEWLVSMYNANLSEGPWGKEALPGSPSGHMRKANLSLDEWIYERQTGPMDWLLDHEGDLIVKEVRLFEDFVKEARYQCSELSHPPYREWYTPDLADYVELKFSREIEIGNYSF